MTSIPLQKTVNRIKDQKVVEDYIDPLAEKSKITYLRSIAEFCIVTKKSPKELLKIAYEEKQARKPPWELSINEWFKEYENHCIINDRSLATRNTRTGIIKGFFHFYEIPTPTKTQRKTRKNKLKIKNKRPALTKEKIKKALNACKTQRLRAIILVQISSGLSVTDVVNLKIEEFYDGLIDIDNGKEICKLHLNRGKTDKEFITFLNYEAVEAIKDYIISERKFESEYLFQKLFLNNKNPNEPKATEWLVEEEYRVLNDDRLKNKHEEKGVFREITSHMCRKFFNTQFTHSEMAYEPRKHMMGHVIRGVDGSYYVPDQDALQKLYIQHMGEITINPTKTITIESEEYQELRKQLKEKEDEDKRKEDRISKLERKVELIESLDNNKEYKERHK